MEVSTLLAIVAARMDHFKKFLAVRALMIFFGTSVLYDYAQADDQYELVGPNHDDYYRSEHRNGIRGHFWLSDGPADVVSSNQSVGNRFRLGGELQFGSDYRWILGATLLDILSSGETSSDVGDISREGWDFDFGYFFIPNRLWLEYSFQLGTVHGSNIGGHVGTTGHALDLGYRFFNQNGVNLAIDAGFLHVESETVQTFDFYNQNLGSATYAGANIWSLSLVLGFDYWG
jgi:hypothetical protein